MVVILVAVVTVIAVVGYGCYATQYKPWHQPIVRVNNTVFDMDYFVKMLRIFGAGQDPSADFELAFSVVGSVENYELSRQAAREFGILDDIISDENVEAELQRYLSSANGTVTEEQFQEILKEYRISEAEFKQMLIESIVLLTALADYIGEQEIPANVEQIQVQAMLLGTEGEALEVRDRWNEGEEFSQLIDDYSPLQNYDEEWLPRGIESSVFDEAAFSLGLDELSQPIQQEDLIRQSGYWLIKILDKEEDRPLSDENRGILVGEAFSDWFEKEKEENQIDNYLDSEKILWALDHV
jgi:foldase protein PrsA